MDPLMEPSLDLQAVITLLGAAQGFLLALALLGLRKGSRTANRLLAGFMAITALAIIGSLLVSTKYILLYPHLVQVVTPFHFLFGPLISLYIRLSTSKKPLRRLDLLHVVPFLLCAAYYAPLYFQSRANKLAYAEAMLANYPPTELRIKSVLLVMQALPYLLVAVAMFLSHSRKLKALNLAVGKNHLFWLRTLMAMILVVTAAGLFRLFFNFRPETILLVPLCFSVLVYVAGYMALKHPDALAGVQEPNTRDGQALTLEKAEAGGPPLKKYEKSNLTPERADEYLQRLLSCMETEKPYTNGDLTLQKLAEQLAIPANHLSQLINERLEQNFFDFINTYRVREVQRLFADPAKKHYSLLAFAEEVGFNSKSTFNAAFKKHTNMTPSEFRRVQGEIEQSRENPSRV
jgi:AraC-like DNA-binding protein